MSEKWRNEVTMSLAICGEVHWPVVEGWRGGGGAGLVALMMEEEDRAKVMYRGKCGGRHWILELR